MSEETKKKIGLANKGKVRSEKTKKQISKTMTGKHRSDETKKKISKARKDKGFVKHGKGSPNWQGGKIKVNCSYCNKEIKRIRFHIDKNKHHFCNRECQAKWRSENIFGENHPSWKEDEDCITFEGKRIRMSIEYRLWRESVFARDNYICQSCGQKGGILNAHHIKSFAKYPELRFAINNGITYCENCHRSLHIKEAA